MAFTSIIGTSDSYGGNVPLGYNCVRVFVIYPTRKSRRQFRRNPRPVTITVNAPTTAQTLALLGVGS